VRFGERDQFRSRHCEGFDPVDRQHFGVRRRIEVAKPAEQVAGAEFGE
jgi:hypothetical protein